MEWNTYLIAYEPQDKTTEKIKKINRIAANIPHRNNTTRILHTSKHRLMTDRSCTLVIDEGTNSVIYRTK